MLAAGTQHPILEQLPAWTQNHRQSLEVVSLFLFSLVVTIHEVKGLIIDSFIIDLIRFPHDEEKLSHVPADICLNSYYRV